MASLASINIKFSADLSQFSSELQNALRDIKKVGEQMQSIGNALSIGFTLPILAAGGASVKMASDFEESLNKVEVAFGNSANEITSFGDTTLETFGIAKGTALEMASLFGDMATSMGLPQSEAADLSKSLVGLAGDLASFKNIGIDEATTALNGVFTGETESLKRLGIVMTEANLAQFALSQGVKKNIKDFSQAEKVQLRYAYIMANTKNAQGDFARTFSGSANQMRVFRESMKEIGQQIGAIILPYFNKLITYVNGLVKSFSNLSPVAKETIVVIAGIVAVVGPLLAAFGTVLTLIPSMVAGFAAVKLAFASLTATIAANPFGAIAVGITLIVSALALWASSQKKVVSGQEALNNAIKEGNKASATEVAKLDQLYKTATDVNASIAERKKAVDSLQALYPAYFKNIDAENIKNGQAIGVYKELKQAIFDKARATAIDNELQKRAEERIQTEIALKEKIARTEAEIERLKTSGASATLQESSRQEKTLKVTESRTNLLAAQNRLLKLQQSELANFTNEALKSDEVLLNSKREYDEKSSKLVENEIERQKNLQAVVAVGAESEKTLKQGSIAYYEAQINALKKVQKEQVTTASNYALIQNEIERAQAKIDTLTAGQTEVKPIKIATDSPSFNLSELKTAAGEIPVVFDAAATAAEERMRVFAETMTLVSEAVGSTFTTLTEGFVNSLGLADSGLEGFAKGILKTITKLIAMALSTSIANSIQGATQSGVATGPAAVFTTPAFIATAVGGVLAAFASIPKFETGGVVGGSSFYGDKVLARVNSGELILNSNQQKKLFGMINQDSAMANVNVGVQDIVIDGNKIRIILDRTDAINNRKR